LNFRWLDGHKALQITPDDVNDLWTVRRIISTGDLVEAWTTREVKLEGDYIRPDKGRRVKVRVRVSVEDIKFDNELGRLRVKGKIVDSNSEMVKRGSYHSLEITPSTEFSLWKEDYPGWLRSLLAKRREVPPVIIVALDSREAGVGLLRGLSLQYFGTVTSEASGKMYRQDTAKLTQQYLTHVRDLVRDVAGRHVDATIVLLGPGKTKLQLSNLMGESLKANVIEGYDLAGEDGVRLALNDPSFRKLREGTQYSQVKNWIDEAHVRLAKNDGRLAMGYTSCERAAAAGAIDVLLISDGLFRSVDEEKIIQLANTAEASGASVILLDSTTVLGLQITNMGGAVALLRYELFTQ
jgi:protein pelota